MFGERYKIILARRGEADGMPYHVAKETAASIVDKAKGLAKLHRKGATPQSVAASLMDWPESRFKGI